VSDNNKPKQHSGNTSHTGQAPQPSAPKWTVDVTPPDWSLWKFLPSLRLWQAVALSLNLEPDAHSGAEAKTLPDDFHKRLRIAKANLEAMSIDRTVADNHAPISGLPVRVEDFVTWAHAIGWSLPAEFLDVREGLPGRLPVPDGGDDGSPEASAESATNAHEDVNRSTSDGSTVKLEVDAAASLSALFDQVTVESLEKMFPADGKWKNWAERAHRNGLKAARVGRGAFNPYLAAMWFLDQGIEGWDAARCNRKLAENLPARSSDEAHVLTSIRG
jgi:hypothetical protein